MLHQTRVFLFHWLSEMISNNFSVVFLQIKILAGELCLDRAVVLKLLRDPPPSLVMLSASLPDKPAPTILDPVENVDQVETMTQVAKPEDKVKVPVHVMQSNWSARKRLKKVQVETLEQVYRKTKRPTVSINYLHIYSQMIIYA